MTAEGPTNNLIAIASGKGGVGKTWFAITLAHALARAGRKVLVFDGDLGLANIDIQLGLMPKHDLGQAIAGKARMSQCVERFPEGNFDVLVGRELTALAGSYQHVLIDLGAGVDKTVQMLAAQASRVMLLVNDEPTSLTDGYAFIKLGWASHPGMDIQVVVNAAESVNRGRKTYDTLAKSCQGFLKRTPGLAGIVRRDPRVREAIRAQQPLITRSPTSEAATDVEAIARNLY